MSENDDVQSILGSLGNVTDREERVVMGRIAGHSVHALSRREGIIRCAVNPIRFAVMKRQRDRGAMQSLKRGWRLVASLDGFCKADTK